MPRLTWDDLVIRNITAEQCRAWMVPWSSHLHGQISPIFMSKFGQWFLRRPDGTVELFDVLTGELAQIALTYDDFAREVNEPWWQEICLHSKTVYHLHEAGIIPGPGECYALAPHPALGGPSPATEEAIDPRFVMTMKVGAWQSICSQAVGHPR